MNKPLEHNDRMVGEMNRCRLAPASPDLQKRVLAAARDAWATADEGSPEVSWSFPCLRLAMSIAAALVLVCFAQMVDRRSLARWQSAVDMPKANPAIAAADSVFGAHPAFAGQVLAASVHSGTPSITQLVQQGERVREMMRTLAADNAG